jgi:hypothetical protein
MNDSHAKSILNTAAFNMGVEAKTDDMELPIRYEPITGPGVDAFENRKERGSPVDLEGTLKHPPPSFFENAAKWIKALNDYVLTRR